MKFNELKDRLLRKFTRTEGDAGRRPDGGTSCYRPIRRRNPADPREQEAQQPVSYIHTGFTGMNPPAGGTDPGFSPEASAQMYGQSYSQQAPSYGQQYSQYSQQAPYGQQWQASSPSWGQAPAGQGAAPQQAYGQAYGTETVRTQPEEVPDAARRPERGWFPRREDPVPRGNISYMPGYAPDAGAAPFSHVEHILILTGLKSCYEAIECMKNGETLIVELDAIANEGESMRCQDMLAGAAFTLGCSVRTLQGARLVLIAPEGVKILPEETGARPEPAAPVYAPAPAYAAPVQEAVPRQRERRSGKNAADWNAARSGQLDNYNPYTGTMPAAAGSYGNFGGYGY